MKIAIIVGSTRPGRLGSAVGQWVLENASKRGDAEFELIELAEQGLALLNEPTVPGAAGRQYENPQTRAWSEKIDTYDGFIFVTPEYNHSLPAAFKNAVDVIYPEWNGKVLGLVGYGADGAVRAVEHWRAVAANVHLHAVRAQVSLSLFTDFTDGEFTPQVRRTGELDGVLNEVVALGDKLR